MRLSKFIVILLISISVFALLTVPAAAHEDHSNGCSLMDQYLGDSAPTTLTPWSGGESHDRLPDAPGDYYLTADIYLTESWRPVGTGNLCLNGHVIKQTGEGSVIRLDDVAENENGIQIIHLFDCCVDREHYFDDNAAKGCWEWKGADATSGTHLVLGGIVTGGNANGATVGHYDKGGAVYIGAGHELHLYDVFLVGNRATDGGGAVYCHEGLFEMYDGDIVGNNGGEVAGVGVVRGAVCMDGGVFRIHDGNITSNNDCCGVYLTTDMCEFEMWGGEISKHESGSGVYIKRGNFIMHDGVIKENIGGHKSGGKRGDNGGVHVNGGVFTMDGGTITGNERDGVVITGGTFNMREDAKITRNGLKIKLTDFGCGVSLSGSSAAIFNMEGGEISYHSAGAGAGVYMGSGTFNMRGGTINNNVGNNNGYGGGGVAVRGGSTFNMEGGFIEKNQVKANKLGGGVYIDGGSKFFMSGGVIRSNTANSNGGGICVHDGGSELTMTGGTITGNMANNGDGGGVCVNQNGVFNMYKGYITCNGATNGGGGVGLQNDNAYFNFYGGNITDNTKGGISIWRGNFKLSSTPGEVINVTGNIQDGHDADVWLYTGKYIDIKGDLGATSIIGEMGVRFNGDIVSPNTVTFAKSDNPERDWKYFESDYTGQTWYVDYDTEDPSKMRDIFFTLEDPHHSTYTVTIPDEIVLQEDGGGLEGSADVTVTALTISSTEMLHVTVESQNNYYMKLDGNEEYKMGYSMTIDSSVYGPSSEGQKNVLEVIHSATTPISQTLSFAVTQDELESMTFAGEYNDTLTFRVNLEPVTP